MKKQVISLAMSVCMLLCGAGLPAFAATASTESADSGVHIMWDNTDTISVTLNFSGDRADCSSIIHGKKGTTKITANVLLKRVNSNGTTTVKVWRDLSATGDTLYIDKSYYVSSGYTYELEVDTKVYRNGTMESIIETDRDYCG